MTETVDRMTRAGNYVLGLMDDSERERAERDLEIDPSFRDAVVEIAERMHVFDHMASPEKAPQDGWMAIQERLSAMPQMRPAPPEMQTADPGVASGLWQAAFRHPARHSEAAHAAGIEHHSVAGRWTIAVAAGLVAAFALGFVAGRSSLSLPFTLERPGQ